MTVGPDSAAGVRVVIVDDDPLVRMALRLVVDGEPDLHVVGEAADGDAALAVVADTGPDVVLMDLRMPGRDGLAATEALLGRPDPPHVLVLTTFDTDENVLAALRAGALGFVVKDTPPPELLTAVRAVAAGDPALSPTATARLITAALGRTSDDARRRERDAARARMAALTEREREVAAAVAEGLSNHEIGRRLHVSLATVKTHVTSLFTKLGVTNRVQIAIAVREAAD